MADNIQKLAVLECVGQKTQSFTLADLMQELGSAYAERSVRRWLSEMVANGLVEKIGQKRGTRYRFVAVSKKDILFSKSSQKTINKVRQPLSSRNPVSYDEAWFKQYKPNKNYYLSDTIRHELICVGQKLHEDMPAGTYARKIYSRLLIDLSYNSSRLEGNTYSWADTQRLIELDKRVEGKLAEETAMILNHKEAIRYLVDHAGNLRISADEIYTLHYLLADGLVAPQYAGKIRDNGVRIGRSTYIPYENPLKLTQQLKAVCKKASQINDPYEQSFFLLVHLGYLQAFIDVNKRTSRLAANIPLITHNLVPLSFNDIERDDYNSAMIAIYEFNDIEPLRDIYQFSYKKTCKLYDVTIEAIGFDEVRVRYRKQRRVMLKHIIENLLTGEAMEHYIDSALDDMIVEQEKAAVREDLYEDLKEINVHRIAGIGISVRQLTAWLQHREHSS